MGKEDRIHDSLVRIEQKAANDSNRNIENANETERSLCGQLMLVSTVFLTVSVVVLGNNDGLSNLSWLGRLLILATFTIVLLSIACGIKYYFESVEFYKGWAKFHHDVYETFRDGNLGVGKVDIEELNQKSSSKSEISSNTWLKRQIALLTTGALCCVALLFIFLFFNKDSGPSQHNFKQSLHHKRLDHLH